MLQQDARLTLVNRLEIIDDSGRSYVNWQDKPIEILFSLQDDGKTLKIFCKGEG